MLYVDTWMTPCDHKGTISIISTKVYFLHLFSGKVEGDKVVNSCSSAAQRPIKDCLWFTPLTLNCCSIVQHCNATHNQSWRHASSWARVSLLSHGVSSGEDFKWGFIPANLTHLEAKVHWSWMKESQILKTLNPVTPFFHILQASFGTFTDLFFHKTAQQDAGGRGWDKAESKYAFRFL